MEAAVTATGLKVDGPFVDRNAVIVPVSPGRSEWLPDGRLMLGPAPGPTQRVGLTEDDAISCLSGGVEYGLLAHTGGITMLGGAYPVRSFITVVDASFATSMAIGGATVLGCQVGMARAYTNLTCDLRLLRGATPPTVGEIGLTDGDRIVCKTGAVDQAVISSSGTTVTVGGAPGAGTTRPGETIVDVTSAIRLQTGGTSRIIVAPTLITFQPSDAGWASATASPMLYQFDLATAGASGQTFTGHAQDVTAADALVGGKLFARGGDSSGAAGTGGNYETRPGHGNTHGRWIAYDADGVTERIAWDAAGDVVANGASRVDMKVGGTTSLNVTSSIAYIRVSNLRHSVSAVSPVYSQDTDPTASVTCDNLEVGAQGASNATGGASAGTSGGLLLRGGQGTVHADNLDGNVGIHAVSATLRSREKCLFIGECVTIPASNPTAGYDVYVQGGALKGRGTSGTVTTIGAAGPHCPQCGTDHISASANERLGTYTATCHYCGWTTSNGPKDVKAALSDDERFDLLKPNDHKHNLDIILGKHRAALPRKRSHEPMLAEYERALAAAVAEADGAIVQAQNSHAGALKRAAQRADEATLARNHLARATDDNRAEHEAKVAEADAAVDAAEALAAQLADKAAEVEATAHDERLAAVEAEWDGKWQTWIDSCEENEAGTTAGLRGKVASVRSKHGKGK